MLLEIALIQDIDFSRKKDGLYLFGHIRSSNAHGNSNVSLLESRGIVDSIASDSDDVALLLETLHDHQLLLRRRTGKHDLGVGTDHLKLEDLVFYQFEALFNSVFNRLRSKEDFRQKKKNSEYLLRPPIVPQTFLGD